MKNNVNFALNLVFFAQKPDKKLLRKNSSTGAYPNKGIHEGKSLPKE